MITRRSSLDFFYSFSDSSQKGELSLIWAQVALCKITTGADLTVVVRTPSAVKVTANTVAPS